MKKKSLMIILVVIKGTLEELMVKNLENVQGDERDIVIISTVYGPNENGVVKNTFGDVVKAGGEGGLMFY